MNNFQSFWFFSSGALSSVVIFTIVLYFWRKNPKYLIATFEYIIILILLVWLGLRKIDMVTFIHRYLSIMFSGFLFTATTISVVILNELDKFKSLISNIIPFIGGTISAIFLYSTNTDLIGIIILSLLTGILFAVIINIFFRLASRARR